MRPLLGALVLLAPLLAGCAMGPFGPNDGTTGEADEPHVRPTALVTADGVRLVSRAGGERLEVHTERGWQERFWSGVNLGTTVPGNHPGQFGPGYDDFARWFEMMRAAHIDTVRIYTVLPPSFYAAFADHNAAHPEAPLWLLHGIWAPEVSLIIDGGTGRDAWEPLVTDEFRDRIRAAVAVVHGNATLPERRGFASGSYDRDVSDHLLGWVVGTEWFPLAVQATNDAHPQRAPYAGTYFRASDDATPFDSWLAAMLDEVATESMHYGDQHPLAVTNWVTTDPLSHPNEPLAHEDLVAVDPNNLVPTARWHAGTFALYHVYPYYPDLLRYEPAYQEHQTAAGHTDPYAGYLHALADAHPDMPVVIGEFGVPSSRGIAHLGPLGRDQGLHNETAQADHFEAMHGVIVEEGLAGALLFEWTDEWFKHTWNTQGLEAPAERRALWRNMLTNEEHFGVIAVEPGASAADVVRLDGAFDDWDDRTARRIHEAPDVEVRVSHDAAYLYLILRRTAGPWADVEGPLWVAVDTLPEGAHEVDLLPGHTFATTPETLFAFGQEGRAWIRAPYDVFAWQYGKQLGYVPFEAGWSAQDATKMLPWRLPLNHPLELPQTGQRVPFEFAEIGHLHHGLSHPPDGPADPLQDWYRDGHVIEVRIPWTLLGFTDPSSRSVWDWPHAAEAIVPRVVDDVAIELVWDAEDATHTTEPVRYSWDIWNTVSYHERPKALYDRVGQVHGAMRATG